MTTMLARPEIPNWNPTAIMHMIVSKISTDQMVSGTWCRSATVVRLVWVVIRPFNDSAYRALMSECVSFLASAIAPDQSRCCRASASTMVARIRDGSLATLMRRST